MFEGTAGTVTVDAPNNPNSITFTVTGYTLSSGTLTLNGAGIAVNTGTATIGSVVAGSVGLTKTGSGTLAINGTCTYSGATAINGGTLTLGVGTLVSGAVLRVDASTLNTGTGINAATTAVSNLGSGGGSFNVGNYDVEASGIGTKNAFKFNGSNQWLESTNAMTNTGTALTAFIVESRISKANWKASLSCTDNAQTDHQSLPNCAILQNDGAGEGGMILARNGDVSTVASPANGVDLIHTLRFDNTTGDQWITTSSGTNTAGGARTGSFDIKSVTIACRQSPAPDGYRNTYIGEVIIYNSALSTADRQSVENYLKAKWGI